MGKATLFVAAAHGSHPLITPDPEGVARSPLSGADLRPAPSAGPLPPSGRRRPPRGFDPFRVGATLGSVPWAAGAKDAPLPTATQFSPFQGVEPTRACCRHPHVSSRRYGTCSAESGGGRLLCSAHAHAPGCGLAKAAASPSTVRYVTSRPRSQAPAAQVTPHPPSRDDRPLPSSVLVNTRCQVSGTRCQGVNLPASPFTIMQVQPEMLLKTKDGRFRISHAHRCGVMVSYVLNFPCEVRP